MCIRDRSKAVRVEILGSRRVKVQGEELIRIACSFREKNVKFPTRSGLGLGLRWEKV